MEKPICARTYNGSIWVCGGCKRSYPDELGTLYNPNEHPYACEICNTPFLPIQDIARVCRGEKIKALSHAQKNVNHILKYMELIGYIQIGTLMKFTWKRKWKVVIPMGFDYGSKVPSVLLALVAANSLKQWGETRLNYAENLPSKVEPFPEEELPTLLGANNTPLLGEILKGEQRVLPPNGC